MGTKTYVVQVEASRKVMVQYWGQPCREKQRACPACKAWERWRKTKQIVVTATEAGTLELLIGVEK